METAVVTGCNRRLGEGIKNKLLKQGYRVYGLNKTVTNIHEDNYVEVSCDVRNYDCVVNAISKIDGNIDLLVVNAAIRVFESVSDFDIEKWNRAIGTMDDDVLNSYKTFTKRLTRKM